MEKENICSIASRAIGRDVLSVDFIVDTDGVRRVVIIVSDLEDQFGKTIVMETDEFLNNLKG